MTSWIKTEDSIAARKHAITNEFDRLIKELMDRRVLRGSILGSPFYVIYTEDGPMDITLKRLAPCLKFYPGECLCQECSNG
jgi:hypothetical protein